MADLKPHPVVDGLEPFCELVDIVNYLGYVMELDWSERGWTLAVSETLDDDPLVSVDAASPPPMVFNALARRAAGKLKV